MEDIVFQIYGTLVLTLAGFVLPLIVVALSAFPEGVKILKQTYENEQKQSEKNLTEELKKQQNEVGVDYDALAKNITALKQTKQKAESRLRFLNPGYILSRSVIYIGFSMISFFLGLTSYQAPFYIPQTLFVLSVISIVLTTRIFFVSIEIIVEASSVVQGAQKATNEKIVELLTVLVDNTDKDSVSLFIDQKDIHVFFAGEEITANKEYSFSEGKKHKIKISIKNLSAYMLKTAELGFTFPAEFLIEGATNIYVGDKEKIIRFKHDYLQSTVNQMERDIEMTFLNKGVFTVDTFVKGENLKNKIIKFKIKVVE